MPRSFTRLLASLLVFGAGVQAHSLDYRRAHEAAAATAAAPPPPPPPPPPCPLDPSVNVVYYASTDGGVGVASSMWIEDFLSWWAAHDPSIHYRALSWRDVQTCNFNDYADTLRLYINPGGWATDQLYYYGLAGVNNIISWMRNQHSASHTYVGICAGGYLAAHDYTWETEYMPPEYFIEEVGSPPPLNLFPHTVEGSIVDIGDDEYGDYESNYEVRYRMVNVTDVSPATLTKSKEGEEGVSVGDVYEMLYYGGSTFGWNALPDYAQLSYNCSTSVDEDTKKTENVNCRVVRGTESDSLTVPLLLYTDFYGYNSPNVPAMWQYGNHIILSSIHPAADESVCVDDCPPLGTLTPEQIEANRLFFANQVNRVMANPFKLPTPSAALKNYKAKKQLKAAPHTDYPVSACYGKTGAVFCDDFNVPPSVSVYPGMFQWQRNQTLYDIARPWNTTFTGTMCHGNGGPNYYGEGVDGARDGWAVAIPYPNTDDEALTWNNTNSSRTHKAWPHSKVNLTYGPVTTTIVSEPIIFSKVPPFLIDLSYFYKGVTQPDGFFAVDYTCNGGWNWNLIRTSAIDTFPPPPPASSQALYTTSHRHHHMTSEHESFRPSFAWVRESWKFVLPESCGTPGFPLQVRFSCFAGAWATFDHFCGVDSVGVFSL